MLFSTQTFVCFFLPAVVAGYYALAPGRTARHAFLVAASLVFYGWWNWRYVPLLVGLTLANWGIAKAFEASRSRSLPLLGVAMNLAVLGVFKYADFLRGTWYGLTDQHWTPWHLLLPLGISFFVFQKISYLIDLRRGTAHAYRLLDFSLFVMFFPQLIAGPITRHNEIIPQFPDNPRRPEMWENLGRGFALFIIGLAKKVAFADTLAMVADPMFHQAAGAPLNAAQAWVACAAYTLQIYFDFSGYSDMAIGIARMLGLRLPFNFDAPYRAVSVRDFWRRWHMTLSRFLRDYLYIPLGGNRRGAMRLMFNLMTTMLLAGLWHGAAWTFVVWGGLHGLGLMVNHAWQRTGVRLPRLLAWILTLLFVMAGWILFRADSFALAGRMFGSMLGLYGVGHIVLDREYVVALLAGAAVALIGPTSQEAALIWLRPRPWLAVPAGAGLAFLLLLIGGRLPNVFIYFQF